MAVDALIKPLIQIALFRGLKPLQITEILRRAERRVYKPGESLIVENEDADAAIVVVEGEAVRVSGPDQAERCDAVPKGALLAELGMLIEMQHTATVVARSAVKALRIPRAEIHAMMAEDSSIADHFVAKISERLSRMAVELRGIERTLGAGDEDGSAALGGAVAVAALAAPTAGAETVLH